MILVDTNYEWNVKPTVKLMAYRFSQGTPRSADFKDRQAFGVSIDEIEQGTGLDFFPELKGCSRTGVTGKRIRRCNTGR